VLIETIAAVVVVVLALLSVRVVPEDRRLGILRLGRYAGLRGPGIVVVLPVLERAIPIDRRRDIPTWRSMSPEQLAREVERLSETGGLGI
jgi:regulator of protease activity HflC (stomatin/prohibitin superfamily)